jgi:O-antigen/teichoic acid export membrane protein
MLVALLGVLVLVAGLGIVGLAAVSIVVNAVTLIILYILTSRMFFRPRFEFDMNIQQIARSESFPLMLNHLLATLFFRVDVILLEALRGDVVVGWYSVAYKWVDALNIIPAFFTQAMFPVMSRQAAEDRPALLRSYILSIKLLTLISLPVTVITILLGPTLVSLLGGAEFLPHGAIALQIFVISIPIGWINSVTNYVVIAVNRQRALTWTFVAGLVFNVVANLIFIPRVANGYPAAAAITIFSEAVLLVMFYIVLRRALGRVHWVRTLWKLLASAALMGGTALALDRVSLPLALIGSLAVYAVGIVLLKPFTDDEMRGIAPLLPGRFRARFETPVIDAVPGEV